MHLLRITRLNVKGQEGYAPCVVDNKGRKIAIKLKMGKTKDLNLKEERKKNEEKYFNYNLYPSRIAERKFILGS